MERAAQWIAIFANVGVLLGFLAIAYQLQLNRESMRQASNLQSSVVATTAEAALMGDTGYAAYAKSISNPSDLTPAEIVQFWTYMSIAQNNALQAFVEYREGRISEQDWLYARDLFIFYFNYPMGRVWFDATKNAAEGTKLSEFWESTSARLESVPENQTGNWFLEMYEGAKSLGEQANGI